MKIKTLSFFVLSVIFLAFNTYAYEVWHTASGKSYDVYLSLKAGKKGKDSGFYMISYKTKKHLDDRYGLVLEYYDLLTHLYHFQLPKKMRDDKFSVVMIEAFKELPKSKEDKQPSRRFTKKLSELAKIVKTHRRTEPNRLQALIKFNDKKFKEAIAAWKKVKAKVPHDYYQTANAYLLSGNKNEAITELQTGQKQFPNDITILNNLAMATLVSGTYILEGKYEYDPGKMEEAKKILAQALALDEKNWLTKSNMAVIEVTLQNFKGAEKLYQAALKLSEDNSDLMYQVASFYHGQKQFDEAKKYYMDAMKKLKDQRSPAAQQAALEKIKDIESRIKLCDEKKVIEEKKPAVAQKPEAGKKPSKKTP